MATGQINCNRVKNCGIRIKRTCLASLKNRRPEFTAQIPGEVPMNNEVMNEADRKINALGAFTGMGDYADTYFEMTCPCKGSNLDKMLQPAILACLYEKDLHGFVLIRELAKNPMFGGSEPDKAGVYRYLKKMEESGTLTSAWEMSGDGGKPRRIFSITDRGRECLVTWYVALKQYSADLDKLITDIGAAVGIQE